MISSIKEKRLGQSNYLSSRSFAASLLGKKEDDLISLSWISLLDSNDDDVRYRSGLKL